MDEKKMRKPVRFIDLLPTLGDSFLIAADFMDDQGEFTVGVEDLTEENMKRLYDQYIVSIDIDICHEEGDCPVLCVRCSNKVEYAHVRIDA